MNAGKNGLILSVALMLAAACQVATAAITVDGYFRLGENDPGATAGQPGQNPTRDATGTKAIAVGGGTPTNSALVATAASRCTGSTLSMRFDGTSYYQTNDVLNANTNNYGIEAWFCPLSTNGSQIIAANGTSGTHHGYELWLWEGEICGLKYPYGYLHSGVFVTTGQWCHVAFVVSNGVGQIYVNGTLCNTLTPMYAGVPVYYFTIGSEADGYNPFIGYVDEVRVFHFNEGEFQVTDLLYHHPADATPVYARTVLAANPVVYNRMNEIEGPGLFDMATNSAQQGVQNGLYRRYTASRLALSTTNGPCPAAYRGFEPGNTAPYFNGESGVGGLWTTNTDNALVNMPAMGTNYSVETWFYNTRPSGDQPITGYVLARGDSSTFDAVGIGGYALAQGRLFVFNSTTPLEGSATIALNTWYHIVLARSGDTVALYLNGAWEAGGTLAAKFSTNLFAFGFRSDGGYPFKGYLDEVAIYNRALTAAEASAHYELAVKGPPCGMVISIR